MVTQNSSGSNNLLAILTLVVVVVALVNISVVFMKIAEFKQVSGNAVNGYVNVTVNSALVINLSNADVNFGAGTINTTGGWTNATLNTNGAAAASIVGGNWSNTARAIIIQNIGTLNFSLNITSSTNASSFIGGSNSLYQFNVSNAIAGTCGSPGFVNLGEWYDVNTTKVQVCKQFNYLGSNQMYLDVLIRIPTNSPSIGNSISDTILIEANPGV